MVEISKIIANLHAIEIGRDLQPELLIDIVNSLHQVFQSSDSRKNLKINFGTIFPGLLNLSMKISEVFII